MGRSSWKYCLIDNSLLRHYRRSQFTSFYKPKPLVVYNRSTVLLKNVNKVFIHKGNTFISMFKTKYNIFLKAGIFSFTRRPYVYRRKK
jgi:ribosomal protein S19